MAETRAQYAQRRTAELKGKTKGGLCALYRSLGGLGGVHPPERWRKDEVLASVIDIEWSRLPDHAKATAPDAPAPETTEEDGPPCGRCGASPADHIGWNKGHLWVRRLAHQEPTTHCTGCIVDHDPTECGYRPAPQAEEQPPGADATARALWSNAHARAAEARTARLRRQGSVYADQDPDHGLGRPAPADHQDMPNVPCTGADCDRECSAPAPQCPDYPQWARANGQTDR